MKILIVSRSILPKISGSAIITENLAKNFEKNDLVVVGGKNIGNIKMNRGSDMPKFYYCTTEFSLRGRGARFFSTFRRTRFKHLIDKITEIIKTEQIDYVLGIYPDEFYCLAALKAAKNAKIPFSSYFHNTFVENSAIKKPDSEYIQKEIFESSKVIFVMSEGMQEFYQRKYNLDKFLPLVHTFNNYPRTEFSTKRIPSPPYKLVAIGNFNASNIDATTRFINGISNNKNYNISLYTTVPKLLLKSRGVDLSSINYMGTVSPDKVHLVLQQYDFCVLTHGFKGSYGKIEYETIFPTRTIPLLLSGKPIVLHSPSGSFLNNFFQKYKCGLIIDKPDKNEINNSLNDFVKDKKLQHNLVTNAQKASRMFYGPQVAAYLIDTLESSL